MATNTYKNVLVAGASGKVGQHVLQALLADSTLNVTVLSRATSEATFPANVKVIKIEYLDITELTKALTNQDVVVSTMGGKGLISGFGQVFAQAAIEANVKWFIPSEFAIDNEDPAADMPLLVNKKNIADLLKKNQSGMAYTLITTGALLDWGFDNGVLGFDISNHTAVILDEGKNLTSGSTLFTIGKAVAAVIRNPQLTLNKRVYVADATFTQQQALDIFEKKTKTKWTVKHVTSAEVRQAADAHLLAGNIKEALVDYRLSYFYGGSPGANFEGKTINKALGVPTISLDHIIKEAVKREEESESDSEDD